MGTRQHKEAAPASVRIGILSVSTSRGKAQDKSGHWMADEAARLGHQVVFHQVVSDDTNQIVAAISDALASDPPNAIMVTGGTGISPADVTIEALRPLFAKELSAFATLFAMLSYDQIGAAAMLSRATAGSIGRTVIFCLPGSLKACQLACQQLIFPELGHLAMHQRETPA